MLAASERVRVSTSSEPRLSSSQRLSERAPSRALKPSRTILARTASVVRTKLLRSLRPRRPSRRASSLRAIARAAASSRGKNSTTRSIRLNSSGGKNSRTALAMSTMTSARVLARAANAPSPNPTEELPPAPRFEVMITTAWRKSATSPAASLSRPSSNSCSIRLRTEGSAFSTSSSRTTQNGWARTRLVSTPSGFQRSPISRAAAPGTLYSLMSRRTSRLSSPNRYSARALAISVLPVPVGPVNRNTP